MRRDVQARMRQRIRERLDELRMTQRELAKAVGHNDAWISGVLDGYQGLNWKDFDAVAEALSLSPADLVRRDDDTVREISPREMRLLRYYQDWPDPIKDYWLEVMAFFAASVPDSESALLLTHLRRTPRSLRTPVMRWLGRLLEEGDPPGVLADVVAQYSGGGSGGTSTTSPARSTSDQSGIQGHGRGPKTRAALVSGAKTTRGRAPKGAKRQGDG
jgi:transcriptional regulator with XRE-family HTH domain